MNRTHRYHGKTLLPVIDTALRRVGYRWRLSLGGAMSVCFHTLTQAKSYIDRSTRRTS